MKMLFKGGKLVDGINSEIHFEPLDVAAEKSFTESVEHTASLFTRYDLELLGKFNDKEVFYLYDKKQELDVIKLELLKIIKENDDSNVVNKENALVRENIYSDQYDFVSHNTIFWDTINHIIVAIGKDSLVTIVKSVEESRWSPYAKFKKEGTSFTDVVPDEGLSPVYQKVKKMYLPIQKVIVS